MGKIKITLSANAGVCVEICGKRIWVDALHDRKTPGFSAVSPKLLTALWDAPAFQKPDAICYTHIHPDHYSRELTAEAFARWPEAALLLPGDPVTGVQYEASFGNVTLRFLRLPHEGAQYAHTLHYGVLILSPEGNILISGDCAVAAPELQQAVGEVSLDVAILDFPWLTLGKGRTALEGLNAKNILLYHLPFSEDDLNGYRASAAKAVSRWEKGNATLLWNPLQTESL